MASIPLILAVFAFVCCVLAAIPYPPTEPHRTRLVAAGLAFWVFIVVLGYTGVMAK